MGGAEEDRLVLFACSCAGQTWGVPLGAWGHSQDLKVLTFALDLQGAIDDAFTSLADLGQEFKIPSVADTYALELAVHAIDQEEAILTLRRTTAIDVAKLKPAKQEGKGADAGDSAEHEVESIWEVDSAASSLLSDAELAAEDDQEEKHMEQPEFEDIPDECEIHDPAEGEMPDAAVPELDPPEGKAAHGSNIVEGLNGSNGYYTIINDPRDNDVKLKRLKRWCVADEIGSTEKSRTVIPKHFDEEKDAPDKSYMVLRAWFLWRGRRDGWADRLVPRQIFFHHLENKLRADIAALQVSGGGTGSPTADALIRGWCPSVLE